MALSELALHGLVAATTQGGWPRSWACFESVMIQLVSTGLAQDCSVCADWWVVAELQEIAPLGLDCGESKEPRPPTQPWVLVI
jgi:hypothetical protein